MTTQFNFDDAVKALQAGKNLNGKVGVLTGLIKQLTESALQAELEQHLANEQQPNRKNGSSTKTVKSSVGNFELDTPRDRSGSFEPQLVKKNQTALTDKLIPELKAWQQRPLDSHYPIVWLDAIHYTVKEDGRYISKAVYTLLGLNLHGKKELLGLHLSENEGANYWLSVLTDLNNRGVKDILIACIDGLTRVPEAIKLFLQRPKYNCV